MKNTLINLGIVSAKSGRIRLDNVMLYGCVVIGIVALCHQNLGGIHSFKQFVEFAASSRQ